MDTKELHIFRVGRHTAMGGQTISFAESDLQATVAAYDPAKHEAPLVIGHPRHDLPAYGWVQSLRYADGNGKDGGGLYALPAQVNPDFADMLAAGAFKKISASFYGPTAPNNPVPGVYYLRHVGFLGAQPPAVKGLRNPQFGDDEAGVLTMEFGEWDDVTNASLWRSLRDWIIGKFGQDEADRVVPSFQVQSLEASAQTELVRDQLEQQAAAQDAQATQDLQPLQASFSQPSTIHEEPTVTEEEAARLRADNERLSAELAQAKADRLHADNVAFCDELVAQGRMLPAARDVLVATLDYLAAQDAPVEFGEGDAKAPLLTALKTALQAQPAMVQFGEHATRDAVAPEVAMGAAADGAAFAESDPQRLAQHKQVLAYMAEHKTDYATAAAAVLR
ncbi:MAG: peptidase [Burkholderiaceae bacterium]|nr:peptidase [Burkholderiaceae bacterium]